MIEAELAVMIDRDRVNANEVFMAVQRAIRETERYLAGAVIAGYQERILELWCTPSGRVAKNGLGNQIRRPQGVSREPGTGRSQGFELRRGVIG